MDAAGKRGLTLARIGISAKDGTSLDAGSVLARRECTTDREYACQGKSPAVRIIQYAPLLKRKMGAKG